MDNYLNTNIMNKQKQTYLSPKTESLALHFEGIVCTSNPARLVLFCDWGSSNAAGGNYIEDAGYDL